MKPQTTNYDFFRISRYVLLLGSCIASISCGSGCNDFGLKNIARDAFDGDWEFYSFVSMVDASYVPDGNLRRGRHLNYFSLSPGRCYWIYKSELFLQPSTTTMVNTAFAWQRFTDDECQSFNGVTSAVSGGQATYNSTAGVTHGPLIRIQVLPEYSNAPINLRISTTYPEDTIFCIEGFDTDIPIVSMPTSATISESSGPKESSPTEIIELPRTSKTTQTSDKTGTYIFSTETLLSRYVISFRSSGYSEKHSLIGLLYNEHRGAAYS
ncbi:hypothetical protein BSL78_27198 [Apostichopus japonicus]|uniref:Uncharacterized protein n=1 Tax=Stichopus japonicus TaxID=307972 RepID=A0A2G8JJQ4_STIJA|nr:hypothetical protein BSL78_27198 [Apostichopus japonicus]